MFPMSSRTRFIAAVISSLALSFALAPDVLAKKVVVGPISVEVPDDFKDVAGTTPAVYQDSSGITVEASALPPEALHEFKGQPFLDYLQSLGFTNPVYADGALKRTDPHTFVTADAKGAAGPETRFLLVIGGEGRAAIVTAYAPKSALADGHASRAEIEAILNSAAVTSAPGKP